MLSSLQICIEEGLLQVKDPKLEGSFVEMLSERSKYKDRLLAIEFVTVQEYLKGLEYLAKATSKFKIGTTFYLAAAVSDFYVPEERMVTHKIQSRTAGPEDSDYTKFKE
jgi:phosphopantothenate-cysteine ligase